jgi:hypothetical protein
LGLRPPTVGEVLFAKNPPVENSGNCEPLSRCDGHKFCKTRSREKTLELLRRLKALIDPRSDNDDDDDDNESE